MHNPLGKLALLALLGGGFAATGDLGRLTARGMQLLESTTVPAGLPNQPALEPPAQQPVAPSAFAEPASPPPGPPDWPAAAAHTQSQSFSAAPQPQAHVHHIDDESPIPVPIAETSVASAPRIPAGGTGPSALDLAELVAGARVLVWLPPDARSAGRHRCVALDLVDPRTGEVLLHRDVSTVPGSTAIRTTGVPSRVLIATPAASGIFGNGAPPTRMFVGGTIECRPLGLAHATAADRPDTLGPIAALAVDR